MQISDLIARLATDADYLDRFSGERTAIAKDIRDAIAALSLPVQPVALAAFGFGNLGVDTGTLHDRPAVFVRPLDHAGSVGARLPDDKQIKGPQSAFEPGEFCLTFPTMEQAEAVLNALTTPPVPPTKGPEDDLIAAREVIDWIDAWISNPVGSYSTMALDGLFAMTRDRILALRSRPASALPVVGAPTHRHVKTGGEYTLLGIGRMQSGNWIGDVMGGDGEYRRQSVDMREVAIYRGADGKLWARPSEEFEDGRFVALTPSVQP